MRTNETTALVKVFSGIEEAGKDPDGVLNELVGMCDIQATSLQRVPGKVLATSGVLGGPVLTLHQLRFRDRGFIFAHVGINISVADEMVPMQGIRFPYPPIPGDPTSLNPSMPIPPEQDLPDWPESYPDLGNSPNNNDLRNRPAGNWAGTSDGLWIRAIPDSVVLKTYGAGPSTVDFVIKHAHAVGSGPQISFIHCTFPYAWIYLMCSDHTMQKLFSGSRFLLGAWDDADAWDNQMAVIASPIVGGVFSQMVTFKVVDMWDVPIKNSDGKEITTTLQVLIMIGEPDMLITSPSPIVLELVGNNPGAITPQLLNIKNNGKGGWLFWSVDVTDDVPNPWPAGINITNTAGVSVLGPMVQNDNEDVTFNFDNSEDISVTRPLSPLKANITLRGYADDAGTDLLKTEVVPIEIQVRYPPFTFLDIDPLDYGAYSFLDPLDPDPIPTPKACTTDGWVTDSIHVSGTPTPLVLIDGEENEIPPPRPYYTVCKIFNGQTKYPSANPGHASNPSEWPLNYRMVDIGIGRMYLTDVSACPYPVTTGSLLGMGVAPFDSTHVVVAVDKGNASHLSYGTYNVPCLEVDDTVGINPPRYLELRINVIPKYYGGVPPTPPPGAPPPPGAVPLKVKLINYNLGYTFHLQALWSWTGAGYGFLASQGGGPNGYITSFILFGPYMDSAVLHGNASTPPYHWYSKLGSHKNTSWNSVTGEPTGYAEWNPGEVPAQPYHVHAIWGPNAWDIIPGDPPVW